MEQESRFGHPDLDRFFQIWDQARGDSIVPRRSRVRLPALGHLAAQTSIYHLVTAEDIRINFIGFRTADVVDDELTGLNLLDLFSENTATFMSAHIKQSFIHAIGFLTLFHSAPSDRPGSRFCSLFLPMRDETGASRLGLSLLLPFDDHYAEAPLVHLKAVADPQMLAIDLGAGFPPGVTPFAGSLDFD